MSCDKTNVSYQQTKRFKSCNSEYTAPSMSPKMKFTAQDSDGWISERVSDQLTTSLLLETKILPTDIQANQIILHWVSLIAIPKTCT